MASKTFDSKDISEKYAKFRPVYPPTVSQIIKSFMLSHGSLCFGSAVDVACGSGQSTFLLCNTFEEVTGIDISERQIKQAKLKASSDCYKHHNVRFIVGDAHNLPIDSSSVDLVTCATAWHWLDPELFHKEAWRVLKSGGCVVVYNMAMRIVSNSRMQKAFDLYINELLKNNCLCKENLCALSEYKDIKLPFSDTTRIKFEVPQSCSISQLLGLMSSMSMYKTYCEKFPTNNLLERIKKDYYEKCDSHEEEVEEFSFPAYAVLGIKTL